MSRVERELLELARTSPELAEHLAQAGRVAVRQAEASAAFYRRFHWGRRGPNAPRIIVAPVVAAGEPLVELGELREVAYLTQKGLERRNALYVHKFERRYPVLAYSLVSEALIICGGDYTVETRGIVG